LVKSLTHQQITRSGLPDLRAEVACTYRAGLPFILASGNGIRDHPDSANVAMEDSSNGLLFLVGRQADASSARRFGMTNPRDFGHRPGMRLTFGALARIEYPGTKASLFRNETQFVNWLRARAGPGPVAVRVGIGDDAAVVRPRRGFELILKADMSLEGVHFDASIHPALSVGHRALARPLSDIAAMGGTPRFALVSLALARSRLLTGRWLEDFFRGLARLARRYRVGIIGGDTAISSSPSAGGFADVVLLGEIRSGAALLRSGARPGDVIFVSGRLGMSRLGLEALRWRRAGRPPRAGQERALPPPLGSLLGALPSTPLRDSKRSRTVSEVEGQAGRWTAAELARACRAHLYPEPRIALGRFLSERRLASAAIDVSDGLSTDLGHLAEASSVGARIWASLLPSPQTAAGNRRKERVGGRQPESAVSHRGLAQTLENLRHPAGSLDLALDGGEDYELLFTVPARLAGRIPSAYRGVPLHRIGEIRPATAGLTLVRADGFEVPLEPGGFDHFSNPPIDRRA